jgi:CheY-like chemotaxis protein
MTRPKKILAIDDSDIALNMLRVVLRGAGYDVVTRDSPFGASAAINTEKPDLVLVDVSMPALRGDKLVSLVRRRGGGDGARLVLYSGQPEEELRELCRACGADGYIRKTKEAKEFLMEIERFLK